MAKPEKGQKLGNYGAHGTTGGALFVALHSAGLIATETEVNDTIDTLKTLGWLVVEIPKSEE